MKMKGFSIVEFMLAMAYFAILAGIMTINLLNAKHTASLESAINTFTVDLKEQQLKAMLGDTEGRGTTDTYSIIFQSGNYTMFHGTYSAADSANLIVKLPDTIQISSTFPSNTITFSKGSGDVANYSASTNTITFTDMGNSKTKTMTVNRYGVITGVN